MRHVSFEKTIAGRAQKEMQDQIARDYGNAQLASQLLDRPDTRQRELIESALSNAIDEVSFEVPGNGDGGYLLAYETVDDSNVFVAQVDGQISVPVGRRHLKVGPLGSTSSRQRVMARAYNTDRVYAFGLVAVLEYDNRAGVFWCGMFTGRQLIIPPQAGPFSLAFVVNDKEPQGNSGEFSVRIVRYRSDMPLHQATRR